MGPSVWQILIILLIMLLLFGTQRLRSLGANLGNAIKGFRQAVQADGQGRAQADAATQSPKEKV
jgi:sec-independent protein translocase protein TatA